VEGCVGGSAQRARCHAVHLVGGYLANIACVTLARRQSPFRIEGQADVALGRQFFVAHGLGEEVCASRTTGLDVVLLTQSRAGGSPGEVDGLPLP
jgi:hypothetical protein